MNFGSIKGKDRMNNIIKKMLAILISILISILLISIINIVFPIAFVENTYDPFNPFSIIKANSNNSFAIFLGITYLIYPYLLVLLKINKLKDINFYKVLINSMASYFAILLVILVGTMQGALR